MRVSQAVHESHPWRIHELAWDFRLEDVWELPGAGGPEDFARLVQVLASYDPSHSSSVLVRTLFEVRLKLGKLFGWDSPQASLGTRVATIRDRLPADLRDGPPGPESPASPFTSLYLTDDEWVAEIANQTVHGLLHLSRIPLDTGGFGARMAVYVKPNGLLGAGYLAAIRPFRHLIVYPQMMRELGRSRAADVEAAPAAGAST